MGNFTSGMDIAKVRQVAGQLDQARKHLQDATKAADAAVKKMGANWKGADESQFAQQWNQLHSTMDQDATAIQQMSLKANQNADTQEQTSAK